jgi:outer membrane receptor protein involved in Fe transport
MAVVHKGKARSALKTADQAVTGDLPASTLVDLFAGYNWGKYSVEVYGTNIFDNRNQLSRFTPCGACTYVLIVPGRPRTIGFRAGMKF